VAVAAAVVVAEAAEGAAVGDAGDKRNSK